MHGSHLHLFCLQVCVSSMLQEQVYALKPVFRHSFILLGLDSSGSVRLDLTFLLESGASLACKEKRCVTMRVLFIDAGLLVRFKA